VHFSYSNKIRTKYSTFEYSAAASLFFSDLLLTRATLKIINIGTGTEQSLEISTGILNRIYRGFAFELRMNQGKSIQKTRIVDPD
jgi:hypothetical protein